MKKIFLLLFSTATLLSYSQSNQVLDFKLGFSPQTSYNQSTVTVAEYELSYEGSQEILETLKSNGIQNPVITKNSVDMETVLKTGKADASGNFPVVIEYLKSLDANGKTIIPNGTLIYGKGSVSSLPKLDSIVAKGLDETFKKTVFQIVQSTFAQLALPEKKLKAGESFAQETPISIPVGGLNIDMIITTTYKLKSITGKNAFFDIDQIYTAKVLDKDKNNINVSGTGTGNLIYDIPNHFSTENNLDMKFIFELKKDEITVKLNSTNNMKQKATITKIK
ncbi:hypothetical protein [Flavobacterium sp. LC2016-01]|uniref:hypothetical protein n=1 Tax=Flavobacterium sp. LC2016-01 TaxID=2675876 RepID=UPI0012BAC92D|nr:hypothetical protein [Flavobacterium sp. LC2016-01]MTH14062.1 hypothetical protein [Flavobacterium sp. LC2016-01]